MRNVVETCEREERYIVQRPVTETSMREERFVVQRPVTETVMQPHCQTVMRPVTQCQTQYVDQGCWANQVVVRAGSADVAAPHLGCRRRRFAIR